MAFENCSTGNPGKPARYMCALLCVFKTNREIRHHTEWRQETVH